MPSSTPEPSRDARQLRVVLFSGGRGSGVLTRQLVANPGISLTVAINGYDDGASTGEVRRFLRDSLGPSDFRKNASRLAVELRTASPALIELLDWRFPAGASDADARAAFAVVGPPKNTDQHAPRKNTDQHGPPKNTDQHGAGSGEVRLLADRIDSSTRSRIAAALKQFVDLLDATGEPFNFSDCSLGNLVFAGLYLQSGRAFNEAVDEYTALVGLPLGLIENVTDGTNAWLVAIDDEGHLLATEEEIVNAARPRRVRDIFLLDRPLSETERAQLDGKPDASPRGLAAHAVAPKLNPRLAASLAAADLIIYAPGTQHSSLFPSYLTPGLSAVIAANLSAIKLLITNIQSDAEITGSNAVDIIDRAVFYLKEKGRVAFPTPCLITHYLVNDPGHEDVSTPYVPLGPLESIEDPRLIRIGNYEEGVTGRHDAARVLGPFLDAIVSAERRKRIAVLLHDAGSTNKVVQTLLEMVRGGVERLPMDVTVFFSGADALDATFTASLPFAVTRLTAGEKGFVTAARGAGFDYVALFESSGMYRGEDLVALASHLAMGRLDAVWGSRRLSVRDIQESYRLRYRKNVLLGGVSYIGSHALSLAYLFFYGRYISDTLSAVRAVRASDAFDTGVDLTDKQANHLLLSDLLRRRAEILEIPVQFFPISPERVKRTSPLEGLHALATIVWRRFTPVQRANPESTASPRVSEQPSSSSVRSPR